MTTVRKLRRLSGRHSRVSTHIRRLDMALDLTVKYAELVEKHLAARAALFGDSASLPEDDRRALVRAERILAALREAKVYL